MKNLILTLGILLGSLISPSVSAQVIVATMESKVEMQSMGKYDNPVMVTQNIQAFKEKRWCNNSKAGGEDGAEGGD